MCSSTNRVVALPARTVGWARMAWRNVVFVGTPSTRSSASARPALASASGSAVDGVCTMTLASSESKLALVR